jgi:hypothetical protein
VIGEIKRLLILVSRSRSVVLDFECGESRDLYMTNWADLARGNRATLITDWIPYSLIYSTLLYSTLLGGKFAIFIFEIIYDPYSERLKSTIEQMICCRVVTRCGGEFVPVFTTEPRSFLVHLPAAGPSNLTECLSAFFSLTENDSEFLEPRKHFICSFPQF